MKDSFASYMNEQFEKHTGLKRISVHVTWSDGELEVKKFPSFETTKCTIHYMKNEDAVIVELHDIIFFKFGKITRDIVVTEFTKQFRNVYGFYMFLVFKKSSVIFETPIRRYDDKTNKYTATIH